MFQKDWLDLVKCDPRHLANTFCIASSPSKWDMRFFFRLASCSQTVCVWPCEFVCMAAQIVWAASWQTTTAMDTGNLTIRQNALAWYVSAKDPCANAHSNGCPIYSIPGPLQFHGFPNVCSDFRRASFFSLRLMGPQPSRSVPTGV